MKICVRRVSFLQSLAPAFFWLICLVFAACSGDIRETSLPSWEEAPFILLSSSSSPGEADTVSEQEEETEPGKFVEEILGYSVEKRPIKLLRFNPGDSAPFLVFCTIHGDEIEAVNLCQKLEQRWRQNPSTLGGRHLLFIPCMNPDGAAAKTRGNAHEVDLNRNFPYRWKPGEKGQKTYPGPRPLSEPESRLLYELVEKEKPCAIISVHSCRSCGGMNNYDGPATSYAEQMSKYNGYRASNQWRAPTPGSFGTYAGKTRGIPTITLEMPRGIKESDYPKNIKAVEAAIKLERRQSSIGK